MRVIPWSYKTEGVSTSQHQRNNDRHRQQFYDRTGGLSKHRGKSNYAPLEECSQRIVGTAHARGT